MKLFALLLLVAAAAAQSQDAQVLRYDFQNDGLGNYKYIYEQTDGQSKTEEGVIKNPGTDDASLAVKGSYTYIGSDGVEYKVDYVADEDGFQPTIEQGPGGGVPAGVVASLLG